MSVLHSLNGDKFTSVTLLIKPKNLVGLPSLAKYHEVRRHNN